jgi:hypothetical protein
MGGTTTAHKLSQDPNANLDYRADFRSHCVRVREPGLTYANNVRIEPMVATGFQYNATIGGTTAREEPRWTRVVGQTVKDGSITWTCEVPNGAAIQRTLTAATWTGEGLTISSPVNDQTSSRVFIGGGVEGQIYEVACEATFSDGSKDVRVFDLAVERVA